MLWMGKLNLRLDFSPASSRDQVPVMSSARERANTESCVFPISRISVWMALLDNSPAAELSSAAF